MNSYEIRYKCATGSPGKMMVVRLLPKADLVGSIKKICEENEIMAGTISSIMGTLQKALVYTLAPRPDLKGGIGYSDPLVLEGPLEFITGQGIISVLDSGELFVHLHGIVSDLKMRIYGGHFNEADNPVASTMDLSITETNGVRIARLYDPETELVLNAPANE